MKQVLFVILILFGGVSMTFGQRLVSGTISDGAGDAVIGANVVVKEAPGIGTITDINGVFQLTVPSEGRTLVISFIGYESQEIEIGNESKFYIVLREGQLLDEIVVTAFGIERKRNDLSVSAQKVTGDEVNQVRNNNFVSALSGKVAGLDIRSNNNMGGSTNVVLRGTKSITGNINLTAIYRK